MEGNKNNPKDNNKQIGEMKGSPGEGRVPSRGAHVAPCARKSARVRGALWLSLPLSPLSFLPSQSKN